MFYYIALEFSFIFLFFIEKRYRKFILLITLAIVTFFLSSKIPTYYDLINYKNMFEWVDINNIGIYPEIGFVGIASLLKWMGLNFYSLTMIFYGSMFYFLYKGINNFTKYYETSFLIFLLFPIFFLSDYIALRQALAIALFFYTISLFLIGEKKFIYFLLLSLTVHYSVLLAYVIFFIFNKYISKRFNLYFYILIITTTFFTAFFIKNILLNMLTILPFVSTYSHYLLGEFQLNIARTIVYISFYFFILFLFISYKDKNNSLINSLFNLYTIGMIITLLGMSNMNINRFANYFMIFIIVLIPNLLLSPKSAIKYNQRILITFIFFVFLSVYYYSGILAVKDVFLTYDNVFLGGLL